MWKKGRLRKSDYFLILALPSLFAASALLQSCLDELYTQWPQDNYAAHQMFDHETYAASRLAGAIELLWLAIYCVKASFFSQFKFYKPPYAYVSPRLTRYYWAAVGISVVAFIFTLTLTAILCSSASQLSLITANPFKANRLR